MRSKTLLVLFFFITLSSFKLTEQIDDEIYTVKIFKWVKNENGNEQKKVILINQEGKIIVNNSPTIYTVNLKTFTKAINNFIKTDEIVKEIANNDPPKVASVPKNGEQFISITIIKVKDFVQEKEFANNTRYVSKKLKKSSDSNLELYNFLESDDLKILKEVIN